MANKVSSKIALSDVHTLEQLIDQAPERRPTEISKRGAIGDLAPKLYAMRAKGYTWRDIGAWLTEHGLPVTPASLQRSLRGSKRPSRGGPRSGHPDRAAKGLRTDRRLGRKRAPRQSR